jgi:MFS family permease
VVARRVGRALSRQRRSHAHSAIAVARARCEACPIVSSEPEPAAAQAHASPPAASASVLFWPIRLAAAPVYLLSFLLPVIGQQLGASAVEIGGLYTVVTLTVLIVRPIAGWGLDRFGRKPFLLAALGFHTLSMLLLGSYDDLADLYVARFVEGIGHSILWIAVDTIAADLARPEERGRIMGRIEELTAQGALVGVGVGLFLVGVVPHGWGIAFAGYTVAAVLSAVAAARQVPETLQRRGPQGDDKPAPLRVTRPLRALLVVVLATGFSSALMEPIYLIYLQDKFDAGLPVLAAAFFPAGLVMALLPSKLGVLSDRYGRARMMSVGLCASGILSLSLPHLPSIAWLVVLYTLSSAGWALSSPARTALVADFCGDGERGRAYGLYQFCLFSGTAIGPLVGGYLYDELGRSIPFYVDGVVLGLSAVWVAFTLWSVPAPGLSRSG